MTGPIQGQNREERSRKHMDMTLCTRCESYWILLTKGSVKCVLLASNSALMSRYSTYYNPYLAMWMDFVNCLADTLSRTFLRSCQNSQKTHQRRCQGSKNMMVSSHLYTYVSQSLFIAVYSLWIRNWLCITHYCSHNCGFKRNRRKQGWLYCAQAIKWIRLTPSRVRISDFQWYITHCVFCYEIVGLNCILTTTTQAKHWRKNCTMSK